MKVVFCWAEVSGYMPACWRELARQPGVEIHILHTRELSTSVPNPFDLSARLDGLSHEMFDQGRPGIEAWLSARVAEQRPDVVVVCGWVVWPYVSLFSAPELSHVRFVLGMDTPWQGTIRQRLGRWRLKSLVRRTAACVTSSERSAEYARWLGVPAGRIHKGFYGFDGAALGELASRRRERPWPRQFLFVGRYVHQKDLATLVAAYRQYRTMVSEPWGLTCCGSGPDAHLLRGVDGLTDAGFKQPEDMPDVFVRHGAFVIASQFEPWGVVIAEASASGLPVICTSACGASDELVRPYFNGVITGPRDVPGVARAMCWIHQHEDELPVMGERGRALAEPYSATQWALRWRQYLADAALEAC
jgi:glycosyltransferase involved in cell wall biosynthesis